MGNFHRNDGGFTVVESLVIIFIVIVIAFAGWFVYHREHKPKIVHITTSSNSTTNSSTSNSTSTAKTSGTSTTKYFQISQWGVEAPESSSVSLEYTLTSNATPAYASFSSTQLDASDTACQSTGNGGGVIERYASTDMVQNDDGTSSGQTPSQYFSANSISSADYAHVGSYYYWYIHPQGECGSSQASQDAQTNTISAVEAFILTLQAIPS